MACRFRIIVNRVNEDACLLQSQNASFGLDGAIRGGSFQLLVFRSDVHELEGGAVTDDCIWSEQSPRSALMWVTRKSISPARQRVDIELEFLQYGSNSSIYVPIWGTKRYPSRSLRTGVFALKHLEDSLDNSIYVPIRGTN